VLVDFLIGRRCLRRLGDIAPAQPPLPSLSIVAPARNEARGIEAAVRSLLLLDYPALEIVIVNDRSTDETGAILERLAFAANTAGAPGPRLTVVTITELPDHWLGKNHAMHVGAEAASGELLLFTDADVVFEPTTLRRAVGYMEAERIDHLTAIPDIRVPGIALNAFIAAFGVFFSMYSRPWKARDPRSRAHIGVGAFNLLRTEVYRAIGTHRAIAMRPDDDMKLGKLVKKHRFRQDAVVARDFVTVEWYASLGELVDGLMKNAFAGVEYSLLGVAGATAGMLLMNVWPFVALLITDGVTRVLYAACALFIIAIFGVVNGPRLGYVIAYPAAALLFTYILWRSALLAVSRGTVGWRGTEYPLAEMRKNRI
jgi:glycosyltransferase involved in cell wall biosynthesis